MKNGFGMVDTEEKRTTGREERRHGNESSLFIVELVDVGMDGGGRGIGTQKSTAF